MSSFRIEDERLIYTGKQATTLEEAWKITRDKWLILEEAAMDNRKIEDEGGVTTCGLCQFFFFTCTTCPIGSEGHLGCSRTPYSNYLDAIGNNDFLEAAIQARAEIEYLAKVKEITDADDRHRTS